MDRLHKETSNTPTFLMNKHLAYFPCPIMYYISHLTSLSLKYKLYQNKSFMYARNKFIFEFKFTIFIYLPPFRADPKQFKKLKLKTEKIISIRLAEPKQD